VNNDRYDGSFAQDQRNGFGSYFWENGDQYHGEWQDGRMCGSGVKEMASGDIFDGEWRDDKANGLGSKYFANGDVHVGSYKEDVRDGFGSYTFANGDAYHGGWKNGQQSGIGTYDGRDATRFKGNWSKGKKDGPGVQESADGSLYVEFWQDGQRMLTKKLAPDYQGLPAWIKLGLTDTTDFSWQDVLGEETTLDLDIGAPFIEQRAEVEFSSNAANNYHCEDCESSPIASGASNQILPNEPNVVWSSVSKRTPFIRVSELASRQFNGVRLKRKRKRTRSFHKIDD
jgi:hypothetical protein